MRKNSNAIPSKYLMQKENLDVLSRLEHSFNEQQTSFLQTRDDVNSLKAGYNTIQRDIMQLGSSVEKLVSRFEDSNKTNWPLFAVIGGILPLVVAGFGFFMTSFTANAIAPIQSQQVQIESTMKNVQEQVKENETDLTSRGKEISLLTQTATANSEIIRRLVDGQRLLQDRTVASTEADANSRTDRQQLNSRVAKVEESIARNEGDRRADAAQTHVQLAEVEQQFHSVSNLENLRAAQQERLNSMLWEKSHPGERYPNGTYFPTSLFQGPGGSPAMVGPR